ncbi:hypothetical protein ACFCX4_05305 [Kitasatospora sp. NPDC056327]|uniref:hypothetical protein n=1 Tax=Kitasatospora sp. NPDC056327 TaxID=3345785 RepID=UPI0035D972D7
MAGGRVVADAEQHHPKTTRTVKNTSVKKTPTRSRTTSKALPPVPAKAGFLRPQTEEAGRRLPRDSGAAISRSGG